MNMEFPETCHPDTITMFKYWQTKCGNRSMPTRGDIDPVGMPRRLLPGICIADAVTDERRFVYRLVGTGDAEVRGHDPTGKSVLEGFFWALCTRCAELLWQSCHVKGAISRRRSIHRAKWQVRKRRDSLLAAVQTTEQRSTRSSCSLTLEIFEGFRNYRPVTFNHLRAD